MKRNDLTGQTFGEWIVLDYIGNKKYLCKCSCGIEKEVPTYKLTSGQSTSCGHNKNTFKDITGQQFNEWTALEYSGNHEWKCRCSCGKIKNVKSIYLRNGKSKSCGHNTTRFKDLTGKVFNNWTVLEYKEALWKCRCTCGKISNIKTYDLINGKSKSCGHLASEENIVNLTNKQFKYWHVDSYAGNQYWNCTCKCGKKRQVRGYELTHNITTSCGCRALDTTFNRFGVRTMSQINKTPEQLAIASDKNVMISIISEFKYKPSLKDLQIRTELAYSYIAVLIKKFNLESMVEYNHNSSYYEDELNVLFPCVNRSNRKILKGKELDLYYPDKRFAIEFNGTYWHSTLYKDKHYHQQKTLACIKANIHLIHIFEYEWLNEDTNKKLINIINRRLNNTDKPIYARNTTVKIIDDIDLVKNFLNKYHLQCYTASSINIGCYYNNELVGMMTFGTPRFSSDAEYELIRLCYKDNINIVGGTNKMFKHFTSNYNPKSVISYCNISKFDGSSYINMGFKLDKITEPNYVWVDASRNKVLSRYQTQKHMLVTQGLGTEDQTADEIMLSLGYIKVYDSGNARFTWNK